VKRSADGTQSGPRDGDLPLERLDWFVHEFARRSVSTHSVTLFKPQAELSGDTVVLSGITNEPRLMKSLENALAAVGVTQLDNQIRILPDEQTLAGKLYGVCTAPQALTYAGPATRSSLQSQLLYGETVMLLDKQGDEYLLHGGDGYWGWVTASAIRPFDAEEFAKYLNLPQLAVTDELILDNGERIPAGARLPIVKNNSQRKDATFVVLLASGEEVEINDQHVRLLNDSRTARLRVEHALQFLHTPYVFGGRSPLGMDCSGLVTNVCSQLGEVPARDAWQQVMAGRLVATPWESRKHPTRRFAVLHQPQRPDLSHRRCAQQRARDPRQRSLCADQIVRSAATASSKNASNATSSWPSGRSGSVRSWKAVGRITSAALAAYP
jgi:hypothetical protein